jgi:hypothetical protein
VHFRHLPPQLRSVVAMRELNGALCNYGAEWYS